MASSTPAVDTEEEIFIGAVNTGTKSLFCYHAATTTSPGFWYGQNPLHFSLPSILYQITIIFVFCRLTHLVLRRLGQPLVISQIVAGIILGPSLLGQNLKFRYSMYSPQSYEQFNTISILATIIFYFMVGVKADLGLIPKLGKKAVAIAVFGTLLPPLSVYLMAFAFAHKLPPHFKGTYLLLILTEKWCLTSFAVLSSTLRELNLLSSKLGRLALSAALIADFIHLLADVFIVTYILNVAIGSPLKGAAALLCLLGLVGLILFVLRPLVLWLIRRTPDGALLDEASLVAVLVMAIGCGLLSELIGFEPITAPFFFGLVLPGGAPLGATLVERIDTFMTGLLLPVYVASSGMNLQLEWLADPREWVLYQLVVVLCVVSKFIGVILPCLYCRMPHRDTFSLALMMINKGIHEAGAAVHWKNGQTVDNQCYAVLIMSIIVFGGGTTPLIKLLYRPEDRFVAYKRRTLQHAKPGEELRVLVCIHHQDNVNPVLAFLEATCPSGESPICVYLLHLIQLHGRADAVLRPYKRHKKSSSSSSSSPAALSESDHIVNAFRQFERQYPGGSSVLPYICVSPYNTMHDDVCSLALDKKATIVILPFHKNVNPHGTISSTIPAVQAVNVNVLQYAPCSVGILVDNGICNAGPLLPRVAVYFLGGADDREALACGARIAKHPAIGLTVVRILPPKEWREEGRDDKIDDRMLKQFQHDKVDGKRVAYREEVVKDGEGTVDVIRETSSQFSLLIVGRREGKESPLTAGLSMWSEYPELGVIGDLLASTDFGSRVSTLVVQQQVRVIGGAGAQVSDSPRSAPTASQVVSIAEQ